MEDFQFVMSTVDNFYQTVGHEVARWTKLLKRSSAYVQRPSLLKPLLEIMKKLRNQQDSKWLSQELNFVTHNGELSPQIRFERCHKRAFGPKLLNLQGGID